MSKKTWLEQLLNNMESYNTEQLLKDKGISGQIYRQQLSPDRLAELEAQYIKKPEPQPETKTIIPATTFNGKTIIPATTFTPRGASKPEPIQPVNNQQPVQSVQAVQPVQKSQLELDKQQELENLLKQQGLNKSADGSYRSTSAQVTPVRQQSVQQNTARPQSQSSTLDILNEIAKKRGATTQEQRASILGDLGSNSFKDSFVGKPSSEETYKKMIADRLVNHYGGSQYTPDQVEAAKTLMDLEAGKAKVNQGLSVADKEKAQLELDLQKLKNQGLVDAAGAKAGSGKIIPAAQTKSIGGLNSVISQMDVFKQRYQNPEMAGVFGVGGRVSRLINTGTQTDPVLNQYNQDIGMLKRLISKEIEGGRMSDQDRQYYDRTLFNPNASQEDFLNALDYYKVQKEAEYNNFIDAYQRAGYDVSGFVDGNTQPPATTTQNIAQQEGAKMIGKYKIIGVE